MTVSLVPTSRLQFMGADGSPLVGGTLATYTPNTFSPSTTWQDMAGANANPNPLTLDQFGSCSIWGSGNYRMVVTDVNGNLVFDQVTTCPAVAANVLQSANNLSDVASASTALINLGVGTAGVENIGTSGATVGLLSSAVTFSGANTHVGTETFGAGIFINPPSGVIANINAGYLGIPVVPHTGSYTFILPDRGLDYFFSSTSTATIPANASVAYSLGDFLMASWPSGATGTLSITSDTLRWPVGNVTGPRTITGPGYIVAKKMAATEWWVIGTANVT